MFALGDRISLCHACYFIHYLLILRRGSFILLSILSGKYHSVPGQEEMLSVWVLLSGLPLFSLEHLAHVQ